MRFLFTFLFLGFCSLQGQSTAAYVYDIFQARCASCHSGTSPAGNLDLEGKGVNQALKMANVYQNIFEANPDNVFAANQAYKRVYAGNAWRSFLFRKINGGLQPNMVLDGLEGDPHTGPQHTISAAEKEAIRQWILFGAPATGSVVDTTLLRRYYAGEAAPSFQTPPPEPAQGEGFQIHLGPFFLEEFAEEEYFWKYPTGLFQDVEVDRLEVMFGPYSHHFIMFEYENPSLASLKSPGFRLDNAHTTTRLVTVQQYADTLQLPQGSAFFWEKGNILDLNTHYINYSPSKVAACEVYVNVFTKPSGTASQEMKVALLANTSIYIPNDGQPHTFTAQTFNQSSEIFLWALTSHTHQWGTDFNVYTTDQLGQRDDMIFDAEYEGGDPTKFYYGYDYQHPPIRYYSDFLPIARGKGLEYEATYVNTGTAPARWGDTSDDEMMVMAFFYLDDTTGVRTGNATATQTGLAAPSVRLGPNPLINRGLVEVKGIQAETLTLELIDVQGKRVWQHLQQARQNEAVRFEVARNNLPSGLYLVQIKDSQGRILFTNKWLAQ